MISSDILCPRSPAQGYSDLLSFNLETLQVLSYKCKAPKRVASSSNPLVCSQLNCALASRSCSTRAGQSGLRTGLPTNPAPPDRHVQTGATNSKRPPTCVQNASIIRDSIKSHGMAQVVPGKTSRSSVQTTRPWPYSPMDQGITPVYRQDPLGSKFFWRIPSQSCCF